MKQERWDKHFLELALACARMSKDPSTKVGAVIVGPDNEVRSTGFNGFPRLVADLPERLHDRDQKLDLIVHAEMNAVLAAARVGVPLKGCAIYVVATGEEGVWGGPPCVRCTVECMQAGIVEYISPPQRATPSRWHELHKKALVVLQEARCTWREVGF